MLRNIPYIELAVPTATTVGAGGDAHTAYVIQVTVPRGHDLFAKVSGAATTPPPVVAAVLAEDLRTQRPSPGGPLGYPRPLTR